MISVPSLVLALTCSAACAAQPATRPSTQAAGAGQRMERGEPRLHQQAQTPEAMRREALAELQELAADAPAEPVRLEDLLQSRLVEGFLILELKEEPAEWPVMLRLADTDRAVIELRPVRRPRALAEEESPQTSRFTLILHKVGEEGSEEVMTNVHLFAGPLAGQLNMAMDRELTDGTLNVTLIQLLPWAEEEPNAIRLHVSRRDERDPSRNAYAAVEARTLMQLARREPELFETYVRPMLEELGLSGALDGDFRSVATQAFLADLPVDDAVRQKAEALLAQLDAQDFADRDAAHRELESLGRPAATALLRLAKERELSLEQSTRVQEIVARHQPLPASEIAARLDDAEFLSRVAQLRNGAEEEALARLARDRLAQLGIDTTTRPTTRDE